MNTAASIVENRSHFFCRKLGIKSFKKKKKTLVLPGHKLVRNISWLILHLFVANIEKPVGQFWETSLLQ